MQKLFLMITGLYETVQNGSTTINDLANGLFFFDKPFRYIVNKESLIVRRYTEETYEAIYSAVEMANHDGRAIENVPHDHEHCWKILNDFLTKHEHCSVNANGLEYSSITCAELVSRANPDLQVITAR